MNCAITSANNFSGQSAVVSRISPVQPAVAGSISEKIYSQQAVYLSILKPRPLLLYPHFETMIRVARGSDILFSRPAVPIKI